MDPRRGLEPRSLSLKTDALPGELAGASQYTPECLMPYKFTYSSETENSHHLYYELAYS